MKTFDLIAFGTGSALNIVGPYQDAFPRHKVAVIDKDQPGGICLTRGCIPTKILVHPAEVVNTILGAKTFGIEAKIRKVDFAKVMRRMHGHIDPEIKAIGDGLSRSPNLTYYRTAARFTAPYTIRVGNETIRGKKILLCTGSRVLVPAIPGLEAAGYHTSDTILHVKRLPRSLAIIGGGYIACEFGNFFAAMGSRVTMLGRNERILRDEEPEVSEFVRAKLSERMTVHVGQDVRQVRAGPGRSKTIVTTERGTGRTRRVTVDDILVAAGRGPNAEILNAPAGGIDTDPDGWIVTNAYLETSQPNVWAFGDANGKFLLKHKANAESIIVLRQLVYGERVAMSYDAVPHAVFTDPEVAGVGLGESAAVEKYGAANVLVGHRTYGGMAKGFAIGVEDAFVKVLVQRGTGRILGAHIVGPQASVLVQEIVNLMSVPGASAAPLLDAMHIHPALTEVVQRAFADLRPVAEEHPHGPVAVAR